MTQADLAAILHKQDSTISNYETGYSCPSAQELRALSSTLNVSVDYLLGITNVEKPMPQGKIIDVYHGKECIDKAILPIAACANQGELMGFVVQEIMQFPGVHTGDLVIVDQTAEYGQGDWVLYDAEGAYWLGEYYIRNGNVILNIRISPHKTLPKIFQLSFGQVVGKVVGTLQWHCRK